MSCSALDHRPISPGPCLFRKISEYIISLFLLGSILTLRSKARDFDKHFIHFFTWSIIFFIFSELSFTLYVKLYGLPNIIGHFIKIQAFIIVYKAFVNFKDYLYNTQSRY